WRSIPPSRACSFTAAISSTAALERAASSSTKASVLKRSTIPTRPTSTNFPPPYSAPAKHTEPRPNIAFWSKNDDGVIERRRERRIDHHLAVSLSLCLSVVG